MLTIHPHRRRAIWLAIACCLALALAVLLVCQGGAAVAAQQDPRALRSIERGPGAQPALRVVFDAEPAALLGAGVESHAIITGDRMAIDALDEGAASATSLATSDFDEDGVPDLVVGYETPSGGAVAIF